MPIVISRYIIQKFLHEVRALGPRAYNAHVAFENIDKLRQLIQACLSQKRTHSGSSRIILGGPVGIAFRALADFHGPELQHMEKLAVKSYAILRKKHRPRRCAADAEHD